MSLLRFSSEHKMIQKEIQTFAETELTPIADDIDQKNEVPGSIIKKLSDLGFLSLLVPEKYGGAAVDMTGLCIVLEELSKASGSVGTILAVHNCLVVYPLVHFSNPRLQDTYLPAIAKGAVGAYVGGSTVEISDQVLSGCRQPDEYVIDGHRTFALNGAISTLFVVRLITEAGIVLCILNNDNGITKVPNLLLGLKSAGIVRVEFNDIRVSDDSLLLHGSNASRDYAEMCAVARLGFAAILVGIAEASLDKALRYSKERKQFQKAICEFPMVQEMLVDMNANIEMARLLVYDAAQRFDSGESWICAANRSYLVSGKTAVHAGNKAIQIHGGYGYTKDYPVERYYRDAKSLQVLIDAPDEIYSEIAKEMLS